MITDTIAAKVTNTNQDSVRCMGLINSERGIQKSVARQIQAPSPDKCPKKSKQPMGDEQGGGRKAKGRGGLHVYTTTPPPREGKLYT